MTRRIAAGEALVGAALGVLVGVAAASSSPAAFVERRRVRGLQRLSPATSGPRRCSACWSCSPCRPPRSSCRWSRCAAWSSSRSASCATRARAAAPAVVAARAAGRRRSRCCCRRRRRTEDERAAPMPLAVGIIAAARSASPRCCRGWSSASSRGSARARSRGSSPSAACSWTRRRRARGQRDRGRGRRGDRAADGVRRRPGALPGGDRRGPGPRAARAHPRRRRHVRAQDARARGSRRWTACAR